jgi:hypothetical protein
LGPKISCAAASRFKAAKDSHGTMRRIHNAIGRLRRFKKPSRNKVGRHKFSRPRRVETSIPVGDSVSPANQSPVFPARPARLSFVARLSKSRLKVYDGNLDQERELAGS